MHGEMYLPVWKGKLGKVTATSRRPHRAELDLIDRVFEAIPRGSVLDLPCGNGRLSLHLTRKGYAMTAGDCSGAMLDLAERAFRAHRHTIATYQEDIEQLNFADRAFDTVLCFRLFQHFPDSATRSSAVAELCRVARDRVAISYASPNSVTSLTRRIRTRLGGRASSTYSTPLAELENYFSAHGFDLEKDCAQLPFIRTVHVAIFRRR